MKYLLVVRHGEVHVIKAFKEFTAAASSNKNDIKRRSNLSMGYAANNTNSKATDDSSNEGDKKADLCILGPNAAFMELSMFDKDTGSTPSQTMTRTSLFEKKMKEASEIRGSSLVTGTACEIGWLSKHIFLQLIGRTTLNDSGTENSNSFNGINLFDHLKEWIL
jgi:hypothetical protein